MTVFSTPRWTVRLLFVVAILGATGCGNRGRDVFLKEGCGNCHRHGEIGGGGAPDLTEVGSRHDAAWVRAQINDPASHNPATRMPAYPHLSGSSLDSLVSFLRR